MDDNNQPDDSTPVEPEVVGAEPPTQTTDATVADSVGTATERVPAADPGATDGDAPSLDPEPETAAAADPAARTARRKLWTVAAAAAAVGAIGGVAVGAVGAEVFDDGPHDGRDGSAQGWEHDRGHDDWGRGDWGGRGGPGRQAPGGDQQGGQAQQGPDGEQQGGQPGGQGGDWGAGGGHSRSGGS